MCLIPIQTHFLFQEQQKMKECTIKYNESPIARGARIKAEIETPSSVFLIPVIC